MLAAAGVAALVRPSGIDEAPLQARLRAAGAAPADLALALARAKAEAVLAMTDIPAGSLVIGADQVLTCDGRWYDRPPDLAAARQQLLALRARSHRLTSALHLCGVGVAPWQVADHADLRMRPFSDLVLDRYLADEGNAVLGSVGGYRVEGPGLQLFESIAGDWFTILGLPLLPLLERLRHLGALPS